MGLTVTTLLVEMVALETLPICTCNPDISAPLMPTQDELDHRQIDGAVIGDLRGRTRMTLNLKRNLVAPEM